MTKYKLIKKSKNNNYCYYILELNQKLYFVKRLISDNYDLKLQLKNEVRIFNLIKEYDFLPQIISYNEKKLYVIYDYINGKKINDELEISEILNYLLQLCDILITLHSCNIIHCDIKPSNTIINDNKVKLIDYGNSRIKGEYTEYGTARYCSVEQLKKYKVYEWFDIYSFGIMMYELLYNTKPYNKMKTKEMLEVKKNNDLISNTETNSLNLIEKIIYKATTYQETNRYKSMVELRDDLYKYLEYIKE